MMRLLADENLSGRILRAIRRETEEFDLVRAQDTDLYGAGDPALLEWAAQEGRILLTHDVNTVPGYAYERVRQGLVMPGVLAVHRDAPIRIVMEDILVVILASPPEEYADKVVFVPL
jgi:hypothetical protein